MRHRPSVGPLLFIAAGLVSGIAAGTATQIFPFKHNAVPDAPKANGQVVVRSVNASTPETVLTLTGLTPARAYVAHYHALGPQKVSDPCTTDGPVTLGFPTLKADADGRATAKVTAPAEQPAGTAGAYINVHAADDLKVILLCAAIRPATSVVAAVNKVASVAIADNRFQPATLTVEVGTRVTWTQEGAAVHNVISVTERTLHSADLMKGESYSYTFNQAGTYAYYCSYHEGMSGTVIVTAGNGRN